MKEAGFNLIRVHIRPAVPGYLDLTDKHGMLVYAESSLCWIRDTPRLLDHGRREVTRMIERDDAAAKAVVTNLLDEFGFDTVDAGPLQEGWRIQRDTPGYGPRRTAEELRKDLATAKRYADQA